jgi:hypothetical protein
MPLENSSWNAIKNWDPGLLNVLSLALKGSEKRVQPTKLAEIRPGVKNFLSLSQNNLYFGEMFSSCTIQNVQIHFRDQ